MNRRRVTAGIVALLAALVVALLPLPLSPSPRAPRPARR